MKNKIYTLESLRGLAAVYVLIHHCRWLLSDSYSFRATSTSRVDYILTQFLTLFKFGHEGVIFFFVLSGFVIHYSAIKNKNNRSLGYKSYLKKRINRIIPPLVFALFITFIFDYLGRNIFGLSTYFTGSKYFGLVVDNLDWKTFIANIFSLQELGIGIKHFGSNGALWSLSYEWWFYLLYPVFYIINSKSKYLAFVSQILLFLIFSIIIQIKIPIASAIFSKMIIWWFGVILAELYLNRKQQLPYFSFAVLGIPIAILFFFTDRLFGDILWGLGFIGLLSILLSLNQNSLIIIILNKLKELGSYSYTLYLIHMPIIYFIHAILIEFNDGTLPQSYIYLFLVAIACLLFAKVTSPYIEKLRIFKNSKN